VTEYASALARARAIDGKGLSKQAFHLLPRIAEVDRALDASRQQVVVESHPELAFQRLSGAPLPSKHTDVGRETRHRIVRDLLGAAAIPPVRGAQPHDVLDALVLTRTATRIAQRQAERLGDGARDARGLAMEIAW
jgi:predicted RNase H-like nuclease